MKIMCNLPKVNFCALFKDRSCIVLLCRMYRHWYDIPGYTRVVPLAQRKGGLLQLFLLQQVKAAHHFHMDVRSVLDEQMSRCAEVG
jgi:hypothetical protein